MPLLISLYYLLLLDESFRPQALVSKYGIDQSNVSENSPSEMNQKLSFTLFTSLLSISLVKWSPFQRVEKERSSACPFQLSSSYSATHVYWRKTKILDKIRKRELRKLGSLTMARNIFQQNYNDGQTRECLGMTSFSQLSRQPRENKITFTISH